MPCDKIRAGRKVGVSNAFALRARRERAICLVEGEAPIHGFGFARELKVILERLRV